MARVSAFQAEGCGFETRLPLQVCIEAFVILERCPCSSVVEHTLGKGEVVGSAPITGSKAWLDNLILHEAGKDFEERLYKNKSLQEDKCLKRNLTARNRM